MMITFKEFLIEGFDSKHIRQNHYINLGQFVPSKFDKETISKEFHDFMHSKGYTLYREKVNGEDEVISNTPNYPITGITVQDPKRVYQYMRQWRGIQGDHQDDQRKLVVWSAEHPTVIRNSAGSVINHDVKPMDVVVLNDRKLTHHAPDVPCEGNRWFIRTHDPSKKKLTFEEFLNV